MQVPLPVNSINPATNMNAINSNVQNPDDSPQINIVPEQNQEGIYEDFNLDLFLEDSVEDQEGIDAMEAVLQYDTGLYSQTIPNFSYKTITNNAEINIHTQAIIAELQCLITMNVFVLVHYLSILLCNVKILCHLIC